jgi:VTC domain
MNNLERLLSNQFNPIQLSELESASLMDRKDKKYVVNVSLLNELLEELSLGYSILEIDSKRIFQYSSTYFDTKDLHLFKMHHTGKLNRYKVRFRNYLDSKSTYFEIKLKDNHGRTLKSRILSECAEISNLNSEEITYLENNTPLKANDLQEILTVEYDRITLINSNKTERITIDLNLRFKNEKCVENFEEMAIVEIKQLKLTNSLANNFLKKSKIRAGGISKYCIGVILFFENVSHNRFRHKFNKLYKPYKLVS